MNSTILPREASRRLSATWHHDGMEAQGRRSVSAGGDIGVAVTGDNNHLVLPPAVRSAYWEQVRRIAPPELIGREAELAALAAFCTADSGPAYAWWRADAWAGKTALMSWFALHPPPGVRIVPFFVTARLRAQNDVTAYVDVVLEQLAELAGEGLPAHLTESTREAHLLHLYGRAAAACGRRGERLVLLVDGLDEDRGVTTRSDAHSIAGLLPLRPSAGMRVVVSGRFNPPLPGDVRDQHHHPLNDPGIRRRLEPSPYAGVIRAEAERELKQLIEAGGLACRLLAFVTVAGGGLTAEDLAELTRAVPFDVSDLLRTRAGRTFGMRTGAYLLAHEELQSQAERMLGDRELDRYREELHAWAETWRKRGWPQDTPEYLLRGYFRLVRSAGDVSRLVELAADEARHDRMLEATGSDAAALAEIRDAAERLAETPPADLSALLRLAVRRARLRERNENISVTLCRAWAELGRAEKAVALARAVPYPHLRVSALVGVARVLTAGGARARALEALTDAEKELYRNTLLDAWETIAEVLRALAEFGPETRDRADRLADRIVAEVKDTETDLVLDVVGFWAGTGRSVRAEELARSENTDARRAAALVRVALALAAAGEHDRAESLFEEVHELAVTDTVASKVADQLSRAGEFARAEAVIAAALRGRGAAPVLCARMVSLCLRTGELERAKKWAARIPRPTWWRDYVDAEVACALAHRGRTREARARAEAISARSGARTDVVLALVEAAAASGKYKTAESAGTRAPASAVRDALIRGAVRHARSGHTVEATRYLADVEAAMRAELPTKHRVWELTQVAEILRGVGHVSQARSLLEGVEDLLPPRPEAKARRKEAVDYDSVAARVAEHLAAVGELGRAETLLLTTFEPFECEAAWRALLSGLIEAGDHGHTRVLIALLEPDRYLVDRLRMDMAGKLAATGRVDLALEEAAWKIKGTHLRIAAAAAVAEVMAIRGQRDVARDSCARLHEMLDGTQGDRSPDLAKACTHLYRAYRAVGDDGSAAIVFKRAEDIALTRRDLADELLAALVETGCHDEAEALLGKLTDEATDTLVHLLVSAGRHGRAARLAGLDDGPDNVSPRAAVALAPAVDPPRGRELVVRLLLGDGSWLDVLPAVVRLEPRAVPWLVAELRDPTAARTSAPSAK